MTSEELFFMRHPNRLRTRQEGRRARLELARKRPSRHRSEQFHEPSKEVVEGPHRKWMQNFSLRAGPPLWLLLKQS